MYGFTKNSSVSTANLDAVGVAHEQVIVFTVFEELPLSYSKSPTITYVQISGKPLQKMFSSLVDAVPSTPLPSILNFRDVGETINKLQGTHILREGLIYRSARPDEASPSDRSALVSKYGIKTIIDLRSTTEHIEQAKKHDADAKLQASAIVPKSDEKAADVLRIPGIKYRDINLNGTAFARALMWKLRWSSLAKLISLMIAGYRTEAISILGSEVMAPKGLTGLGKETLDHSFAELHQIFSILADSTNYPILIHCTQGKYSSALKWLYFDF